MFGTVGPELTLQGGLKKMRGPKTKSERELSRFGIHSKDEGNSGTFFQCNKCNHMWQPGARAGRGRIEVALSEWMQRRRSIEIRRHKGRVSPARQRRGFSFVPYLTSRQDLARKRKPGNHETAFEISPTNQKMRSSRSRIAHEQNPVRTLLQLTHLFFAPIGLSNKVLLSTTGQYAEKRGAAVRTRLPLSTLSQEATSRQHVTTIGHKAPELTTPDHKPIFSYLPIKRHRVKCVRIDFSR